MNEERIISILEIIPKDILIHCAEQLFFKKNNKLTDLEVELEKLTNSLRDIGLEDFETTMKKIKTIKEQMQKKSGILIIPGAKYYNNNTLFSIFIKDENFTDFQAILKNNSLYQLDIILKYLGDSPREEESLYEEEKLNENYKNYLFTQEYKNLKNKKLLRIRELINLKKPIVGEQSIVSNSKEDCISKSKVPLRDYQVKAINFINDPLKNSLLIVHGTGTGKTLTALTASQCYLNANPTDKVVVISPASLVGNFEKEMKKYGGRLSTNYSFYSFDKFRSLNQGAFTTPFDMYYRDEIEAFTASNPELDPEKDSAEIRHLMTKEFATIKKDQKTRFSKYKERSDKINITNQYDCKKTMVIIDEAHNMRNMGIGYKAAFKCVIQSKKLLLLTATPFVNKLHDFVPIINMLYRDEKILIKLKKLIPQIIDNDIVYLKALDNIGFMLQGKVTYLNDKNSEFFPTVRTHKMEIDMTPDYFKKYAKALVEDRDFGDAPEVFFNGFRRAVNKVGAEEYINEKLGIILNLVDEGRQTLVFTNWIEAGINVLIEAFNKNGISYLIISGKILASKRLQIVEQFNNKKVQVLIITLAGSEGLDLKEVRDVIILDPVWSPSVMEQIVGRAVRYLSHIKLPKSEQIVDVYNLILKTPLFSEVPSGDEILYAFIYNKQKQTDDLIEILQKISI
jgi:superfamily II DNA or RNA helicase